MNEALTKVPQLERADTLTDQAESVLRQALMSGGFRPGQTITIRALSAMLGVSVTPAKDAMARLIAERVLEWGRRRSALVPELTLKSVDEIYTIRFALETTAATAAVPNFDEKAIIALEKTHERLSKAFAKQDYPNVLVNNRDFHFGIYERANLPILLGMIEGLWLRLGPSLNLLYSSFSKADWAHREGTGYHEEIVAALRAKDAEAVRAQIIADLTTGRDRLEATIESAGGAVLPAEAA